MARRFDGKVVLISGGACGQGAAEARMLVAEGAKVVLGDVLEAEGRALAQALGAAAVFVRQDVTEEADWARAVATATAHGTIWRVGISGMPRPYGGPCDGSARVRYKSRAEL